MMASTLSWLKLARDVLYSNFEGLNRPYKYFLVVTKDCDSHCKFCKIWMEKPQNQMSLSEYEQLAIKSPFLKWLNISGGEPTSRDDLPAIIESFHRHCPDLLLVNFTSNGINKTRIVEQVREIQKMGLNKLVVNISLDGPPEVHDKLRGTPGNFISAVETFKELRSLTKMESYFGYTMYGPNNAQIFETIEAVRPIYQSISARDFHLNLPQKSGHFYGNSQLVIKDDPDLAILIEEFEKHHGFSLKASKIFDRIYRKKAMQFAKEHQMPMTCSSIMSSVYISEFGDIFPCTIWDKKLGALRENNYDLSSILQKEEVQTARKMIRNSQCPTCWTPCEAYHTIGANIFSAMIP